MSDHEEARLRLPQDDPRLAALTVRDRMLGAGISEGSFLEHLAAGTVVVMGLRVSNPDTPAPWPTPIGLALPPQG